MNLLVLGGLTPLHLSHGSGLHRCTGGYPRTLRYECGGPEHAARGWEDLTVISYHSSCPAPAVGTVAEAHVRAGPLKSQLCHQKAKTGGSRGLENAGDGGEGGAQECEPQGVSQ